MIIIADDFGIIRIQYYADYIIESRTTKTNYLVILHKYSQNVFTVFTIWSFLIQLDNFLSKFTV